MSLDQCWNGDGWTEGSGSECDTHLVSALDPLESILPVSAICAVVESAKEVFLTCFSTFERNTTVSWENATPIPGCA